MIAKVRIAPVERWCERQRARAAEYPDVNFTGLGVRILTETYTKSDFCDGRVWVHEPSSVNEFRALIGKEPKYDTSYICSHMVELD